MYNENDNHNDDINDNKKTNTINNYRLKRTELQVTSALLYSLLY